MNKFLWFLKEHCGVSTGLTTLLALPFPSYCPECRHNLQYPSQFFCDDCWESARAGLAEVPLQHPDLKNRLFVAYAYSSCFRILVHQMKFTGRRDLATVMGQRAARRFLKHNKESVDLVIPVPLHPLRIRERGYDQNLLIARAVADVIRADCETGWLKRVRHTYPQSHLSDAERRVNLNNAFVVIPSLKISGDLRILLVDDVVHTGTTTFRCLEKLKEAGAVNVRVLAVCG